MKIFSLFLSALLGGLVACGPVTKSNPKKVETEAEEEKAYGSRSLTVAGYFLALPGDALAVAAMKQGKALAREKGLRADERAEMVRQLNLVDWSSVQIARTSDGARVTLSAAYVEVTRETGWERELEITFKAKDGSPLRWEGSNRTQNFVITCLPLKTDGACDPTQASVIEVFSKQTMSNHRPRTLSFLYTQSEVSTSTSGTLPTNVFSNTGRGTLRTLSALNASSSLKSVLTLDIRAWYEMRFSAKIADGSDSYTWSMDKDAYTLRNYTYSRAPVIAPKQIELGLENENDTSVAGKILTVFQRELTLTVP